MSFVWEKSPGPEGKKITRKEWARLIYRILIRHRDSLDRYDESASAPESRAPRPQNASHE